MDTILKSLRVRDEELALADKDGSDAGPARVVLAESPTGTGKVSAWSFLFDYFVAEFTTSK